MNKLHSFSQLETHFDNFKNQSLENLFHKDSNRLQNFTFSLDDLYLDLSKNKITQKTVDLYIKLAQESNLPQTIKAMFSGKSINFTEHRAVLHTALRNSKTQEVIVNGTNYAPTIQHTYIKMCEFAHKIINGQLTSYNNQPFEYVVNIGIGGSYLGTCMAYNALGNYKNSSNLKVLFLSNVDSANFQDVLQQIDISKTLFIVASKTFTTQETMLNANIAKQCVVNCLGAEAVAKHFVALSTNIKAIEDFGINKNYTFGFWDFIGGRYSIWSAIGLPLMLKIGVENFAEFLHGAYIVDQHFQETPLEKNIPFLLAITSMWYINFYNYNSYAILPYDYRLRDFTRYIQQLEMESNGKSINKNGELVTYNTSPVVFGEQGTDCQHSFFQLIHQGTITIPCDFIGFANGAINGEQQNALIANMFAQSEALMLGKSAQKVQTELQNSQIPPEEIDKLIPHKTFAGNKPSTIFLFKELSPKTLGMLCAIYEHKIFTQGILWQINSFDQWGVELGKQLTKNVLETLENNTPYRGSNFYLNLINKYKAWNNN